MASRVQIRSMDLWPIGIDRWQSELRRHGSLFCSQDCHRAILRPSLRGLLLGPSRKRWLVGSYRFRTATRSRFTWTMLHELFGSTP